MCLYLLHNHILIFNIFGTRSQMLETGKLIKLTFWSEMINVIEEWTVQSQNVSKCASAIEPRVCDGPNGICYSSQTQRL